MIKYADRVLETSTTTGTGTINLAGPTIGAQSFVSGVGNGAKVAYFIEDGTDWESGIGTVTAGTPDTLSRDAVLESSNSDALVNWGAGTRNVFIGAISHAMVWRDENLVSKEGFSTAGGTANAQTLTLYPAPIGFSDGMLMAWYSAGNITGSATVNPNELGAKTLKWRGSDLTSGAYNTGDLMVGRYSEANNWVEMVNPPRNVFATATQGAKADTALQPLAGQIVKTAIVEYATSAAITATFPLDDTIPQNTEGIEIISTTYTMVNSGNNLRVYFQCQGSHSTATASYAGIFRDSVANAISFGFTSGSAGGFSQTRIPPVIITPGASTIDLKVRIGVSAGTYYINGISTGRMFGGVSKATLVIEEIKI
ncbi:hypothetical protein [Micavibrio aeruginosavorus]|uniref:Tail fiber domain protein n=1 Tax=Micavibrio aeruginosavorus (strain ARL-13) TaxID=856793 RepID=G2KLQ2_MICAA|nr:hypothetical protein [Micavibrio aeruginosavorus]AEP08882.1 tail fiber domain protein [Micavibrio aeruginosavorus ARL-13]